jgi:hypothetical protein
MHVPLSLCRPTDSSPRPRIAQVVCPTVPPLVQVSCATCDRFDQSIPPVGRKRPPGNAYIIGRIRNDASYISKPLRFGGGVNHDIFPVRSD